MLNELINISDEVLKNALDKEKNIQEKILKNCNVGLKILEEYNEEEDLKLRSRVLNFVLNANLAADSEKITGLIIRLNDLQWELLMTKISALAANYDGQSTPKQVEEDIKHRNEVVALLKTRKKILTGVLYN